MKHSRMMLVAAALGLATCAVAAQPGGGKGPGAGPGPMAAGPAASGAGMGMGPGAGRGMARWGSDTTPGWGLMSTQERNAHRDRMRAMKTYEECKAYQAEHHEQMVARAQERGGKALPMPRRDPCAGLKK